MSVAVETTRISAVSSTARMAPNRMFIRSTAEPRNDTISTPSAMRGEIGRGEACILAHAGEARDHARDQRRGDAGQKAAEAHRRQRQAAQQEAQRRAGQQRMGQRIAHQAHAAQDQEHADRRAADRQRQARHQGAAHEAEIGEGLRSG